jgi:hypothetical protein
MDHSRYDIDTLLEKAREAGLHFAATAPVLTIWGKANPETDALAAELRRRSDEIVAHLRTYEPVALDTGDPDALTGDMPLSVLKALAIGWYFDTFAAMQGELDWERQAAGRDASTPQGHAATTIAPRVTGRYSLREGGRRG